MIVITIGDSSRACSLLYCPKKVGNALLSKNIDHSRFAQPSPEGLAFIVMLKLLIVHNAAIWDRLNLVCELSICVLSCMKSYTESPVNMILYVRP